MQAFHTSKIEGLYPVVQRVWRVPVDRVLDAPVVVEVFLSAARIVHLTRLWIVQLAYVLRVEF